MQKKYWKIFVVMCIAVAALCLAEGSGFGHAAAETVSFKTYKQAVSYAQSEKPRELDVGQVTFAPTELLKILQAMPEGGVLKFTTEWQGCSFSDESTAVDLRKIKKTPTKEDLEAIVKLCPQCGLINAVGKRALTNGIMTKLADKYPHIQFGWTVHIAAEYYVSSLATTFSTFIGSKDDSRLNDQDLEVLKYCRNLKALDLGHNNLYKLDFLKYVPNLEMLIVACNHLTDISPISQLQHLQYLEIFTNKITDLSPLAECRELLDLSIANTRITTLSALDSLTSLQRLWVKDCKSLPTSEITRFKEVHPDCWVGYKKTDGGWREHERYYHYRWCLKNNQWIPFDQPLPTGKKSALPGQKKDA